MELEQAWEEKKKQLGIIDKEKLPSLSSSNWNEPAGLGKCCFTTVHPAPHGSHQVQIMYVATTP